MMSPGCKVFIDGNYKYHVIIDMISDVGIWGKFRSLYKGAKWCSSGLFLFRDIKEIRALPKREKTKKDS